MPEHRIATQAEWQTEREALLKEEKELTHRGDEVTAKRRALPWVEVEQDYEFESVDGTKKLPELFDGRSQLFIYHFMFGPPYEAGCTVCSSIADNINANAPHLKGADVTPLLVSRAPVERLQSYKQRMGWDGLDWVSTGDEFNRDLGFLNSEEELRPFLDGEVPANVEHMARRSGVGVKEYVTEGPGMSVYVLEDGSVYRTYVTSARGLEAPAMAFYALLDRTPKGRQEAADEPMWLKRHDEYDAG
jgi:predicted dithiol-disulfide oxidoreductase (DUF899 family)